MELGNMMFGNSRGEFSIERGEGFEEELVRLFEAYAPNRDSSWREYGEEFENDTFSVFPYYWGDCECGFENADWKWSEENNHRPGCYQTEYQRINQEHHFIRDEKNHDKLVKELCVKHNLSYPAGSAVHCTCDHDSLYAEWRSKNDHKSDCKIIKPNFHYKPTNYQMKWYKYPLRDAYQNQDITLNQFRKIIDSSIASLSNS